MIFIMNLTTNCHKKYNSKNMRKCVFEKCNDITVSTK